MAGGVPGEPLDNRQIQLIAVCTVCLFVSTLAVALRLFVRRLVVGGLWSDDYLSLLSLITSYLPNVFTLAGISVGLGRHQDTVPKSVGTSAAEYAFVQQLGWVFSVTLISFTILVLYHRLFPVKWMKYSVYVIFIFMVLWFIANFFGIIFQCRPVYSFWKPETPGRECFNRQLFYLIGSAIQVATVLLIYLLPVPVVLKLQVTTQKKVGLIFTFSIGALVCAASVVRLYYLTRIITTDLEWTSSLPQLWTCIEVSFGVAVVCIPSLMPLFLALTSHGGFSSLGAYRRGSDMSREKGRADDSDKSGGSSDIAKSRGAYRASAANGFNFGERGGAYGDREREKDRAIGVSRVRSGSLELMTRESSHEDMKIKTDCNSPLDVGVVKTKTMTITTSRVDDSDSSDC